MLPTSGRAYEEKFSQEPEDQQTFVISRKDYNKGSLSQIVRIVQRQLLAAFHLSQGDSSHIERHTDLLSPFVPTPIDKRADISQNLTAFSSEECHNPKTVDSGYYTGPGDIWHTSTAFPPQEWSIPKMGDSGYYTSVTDIWPMLNPCERNNSDDFWLILLPICFGLKPQIIILSCSLRTHRFYDHGIRTMGTGGATIVS